MLEGLKVERSKQIFNNQQEIFNVQVKKKTSYFFLFPLEFYPDLSGKGGKGDFII